MGTAERFLEGAFRSGPEREAALRPGTASP